MREGNCCDSCKAGTHNPDKSYALASWQDYLKWLGRLGYHATLQRKPTSITVIEDDGTVHKFESKREIFDFLIGDA